MPEGPRYEDDFYAWTQYQAQVLCSLRTRDSRFDRDNLVEEIESLGRSERDAEERLARLYVIARKQAALDMLKHHEDEAAQSLPTECPYTLDQILAEDWHPDPAAGTKGEAE